MGRPNLVPIFTATNAKLHSALTEINSAYDTFTQGVDPKQLSPNGIINNITTAKQNIEDGIKTLEKLLEQLQ